MVTKTYYVRWVNAARSDAYTARIRLFEYGKHLVNTMIALADTRHKESDNMYR